MLARIIQTAGDPAPHDPELRPYPFLFVCIHVGSENFCRLFGTPLVEGITETGAQRVARELKPEALVIGRTAAPSCSGKQRTPNLAPERRAPLRPWTERPFLPTPQPLDRGA